MTEQTQTWRASPAVAEARPRRKKRTGPWSGRSARAWIAFFGITLTIFGTVHLYLAARLVLDVQLGPVGQALGIGVLLALALGTFAAMPVSRMVSRQRARWVAWPAYGWMGLMFLLLAGFVASDLLMAALGLTGVLDRGDAALMLTADRWQAGTVLALALGTAGAGLFSGLRTPAVRRVEVTLTGWPQALDGFRVVQLSDLHIGPTLGAGFAHRVTERTNALQPDLIAITGDLVDGSVEELASEAAPLAGLRARHGVYAVTGNHDYYSGVDPWLAEFASLGMTVLGNERVTVEHGGARFELAGLHDRQGKGFGDLHGENLDRALDGYDPADPLLLLAHQPLIFDRAAERGADLQLSGHTHGGQIFPFSLLTRSLYSRYVSGLHRKGAAALYVSRGTGFWGPPIRVLVPSEITELTLRSAS